MKTFFSALGNLLKKPVTTRYPFEQTYKPDDYRGLIGFEESLCIWCRRCEAVCPPGAIVFSQDMEGKQTYHYNRAVCIYCHECVRACPKEGALFQTAEPAPCALKEENINNGWKAVSCMRRRKNEKRRRKRLRTKRRPPQKKRLMIKRPRTIQPSNHLIIRLYA